METLSQQEGISSPGALGARTRRTGHQRVVSRPATWTDPHKQSSIKSCQIEAQPDLSPGRYNNGTSRNRELQSSPGKGLGSPATSSPDLPSLSRIREFAVKWAGVKRKNEEDHSEPIRKLLPSSPVRRTEHLLGFSQDAAAEESPILHDAQVPLSDSQMPDTQVMEEDVYPLLLEEHLPESKRFLQPVTPASNFRRAAPTPSTGDTPKLPANLLGGAETPNMMGLTQLFKASSPILRRGSSNIMSDRPSPGFRHSSVPLTSPKQRPSLIGPITSSPPQEKISSPLLSRFSDMPDTEPRILPRESLSNNEALSRRETSKGGRSATVTVTPEGRKVQLKGERRVSRLSFTAPQPLSTINEASTQSSDSCLSQSLIFTKAARAEENLAKSTKSNPFPLEVERSSQMDNSPGLQTAQAAQAIGNPPHSSDTDRITETQKSNYVDETLAHSMEAQNELPASTIPFDGSVALGYGAGDQEYKDPKLEKKVQRGRLTAPSGNKPRAQTRPLKTPTALVRADSGFLRQLSSPVKGFKGDTILETVIKKRRTAHHNFGDGEISGLPKFSSTEQPIIRPARRKQNTTAPASSSPPKLSFISHRQISDDEADKALTDLNSGDSSTDEDEDRSWLTAQSKLPDGMPMDESQALYPLIESKGFASTFSGRVEKRSLQLRSPAKSDGSPRIIPPNRKRRRPFNRQIHLDEEEEKLLLQSATAKGAATEKVIPVSSDREPISPTLYPDMEPRKNEQEPQNDSSIQGDEVSNEDAEDNAVSPSVQNRVFAQWRGNNGYYYAATILREFNGKFRVRFEDGNVDTRSTSQVRALEVQVGDTVKVDMDQYRKNVYVVCGFPNDVVEMVTHQQLFAGTDIHGHASVLVRVHRSVEVDENASAISVPISSLYLTKAQWKQWDMRPYEHKQNLEIPPEGFSVNDFPSSLPETQIRSNAILDNVHSSAVHPFVNNDLFEGMCFALTFFNEGHKPGILSKINSNGGIVFEDGFQSIFQTSADTESETAFTLSLQALKFSFSALITDKHSRRPKYMQALALGVPCLSFKWIEDCVSQRAIVSWTPYLLPSGESSYLGGAVRSRTFKLQPTQSNRLIHFVEEREKLLEGHSVIVLTAKGKAGEKRKTHIELAHILAPHNLKIVHSIADVKSLLEQNIGYNLVYVSTIDDAAGLDDPVPGTQKRKKKSTTVIPTQNSAYKVITDEMIIQSLIFGKLILE